jgi:hypothetical protein
MFSVVQQKKGRDVRSAATVSGDRASVWLRQAQPWPGESRAQHGDKPQLARVAVHAGVNERQTGHWATARFQAESLAVEVASAGGEGRRSRVSVRAAGAVQKL